MSTHEAELNERPPTSKWLQWGVAIPLAAIVYVLAEAPIFYLLMGAKSRFWVDVAVILHEPISLACKCSDHFLHYYLAYSDWWYSLLDPVHWKQMQEMGAF